MAVILKFVIILIIHLLCAWVHLAEFTKIQKSSIVLRDTAASNKDIPDNSPLVIHLVDTFLGSGAGAVPVTLSVSHATKGWLLLAER